MATDLDLNALRAQVDAVDNELARLLRERMDVSEKIALEKQKSGTPLVNRAREREILARVLRGFDGMETYAKAFFTLVFDLSKSYQSKFMSGSSQLTPLIAKSISETAQLFPKKGIIACQGVEGSYSQHATDKLFPMANIMYFDRFDGVFGAVESGLCDYGILPIENSSYGSVGEVYDLMRDKHFYIVRGIKLQVRHALLAKSGTTLANVTEICSHGQALGQCQAFLKKLPKSIKIVEEKNTAVAAKKAASTPGVAAIASVDCADNYGLDILAEGVQDNDSNYTRFICISKRMEIYPGSNRVSIMLSLPHEPGSLYSLLGRFAALGYNLEKLESRPIVGQDFQFMFYFDFAASVVDEEVARLLGELDSEYKRFVFFGNYLEQ